jgi:hypothetical protein
MAANLFFLAFLAFSFAGNFFSSTIAFAQNIEVPYKVAQGYFIKNTVKDAEVVKILTQEQFDRYFGPAYMNGGSVPTEIDFKKHMVIAVLCGTMNQLIELNPVSLKKDKGGNLHFTYKKANTVKISYTASPFLIIVADKAHDGKLKAVEQK